MSDQPADELVINIDFDGPFTIDEVELIEALTGKAIQDLESGPRGRSLRVVAWVVGRRQNPALNLADVGGLEVRLG